MFYACWRLEIQKFNTRNHSCEQRGQFCTWGTSPARDLASPYPGCWTRARRSPGRCAAWCPPASWGTWTRRWTARSPGQSWWTGAALGQSAGWAGAATLQWEYMYIRSVVSIKLSLSLLKIFLWWPSITIICHSGLFKYYPTQAGGPGPYRWGWWWPDPPSRGRWRPHSR